ncbi:MAG: TauD/TfdA family dioxygenase [Pseudomonadota bacterium]
MNNPDPRLQISSIEPAETRIDIIWQDGHVSHFPTIWLLHACQCKTCGSTESALRQRRITDYPENPIIQSHHFDQQQLSLQWDEDHHSNFALNWLRHQCLSGAMRKERKFKPRLWGKEMQNQIPLLSYPEVATSKSLRLEFLELILNQGFVLLDQVPEESNRTEEIASLVGTLRTTNYGIYELKSKPNPEISGDTAAPLMPHTDEPYRIDPPGITFFHVIKASIKGGASTLTDSFRLAQQLRTRDPKAFELLCRIPARFHRRLEEGRFFEYQHPVIECDHDGDISAVRLLDRGMAPVDCREDQVNPFYSALKKLLNLSYQGDGQIEFALQSGQMLVFNNQRLMHGRTAFDPSEGRHVRTCSVDLDEFYSRLRVTYRELNDSRQWMTFRKY